MLAAPHAFKALLGLRDLRIELMHHALHLEHDSRQQGAVWHGKHGSSQQDAVWHGMVRSGRVLLIVVEG